MARRLSGLDTTALIGLIGTIVTALLSTGFFSTFLVNPAVYVEVSNSATSQPYMLITNDGSKPAHNVSLFVLALPGKIVNVTNIFSTTNVTLMEPHPKTLEEGRPVPISNNSMQILIPVLTSGIGSRVEIETLLESESEFVRVIAVYDEGSTVESTDPSLVREMSFFISDYYFWFVSLSGIAIIYAGSLLWVRGRNKRLFIEKLVKTLENVHRKLADDYYTAEGIHLYKLNILYDSKDSSTIRARKRRYLQKIMKNPKDYIIIDDVNSKIEERNKKIENQLEPLKNTSPEEYRHELKELNIECLNQIHKALDIDWENYY